MQQKLLRKAGLLGIVLLTAGVALTGCIDEPNPPVLGQITSNVRFVHAVPNAGAMDIYADENKIASNVGYKGYSQYLTVNSGNRFLRLVPAGQDTSQAVFRQLVSVRSLTQITMAFHNAAEDVMLLSTQERFTYADETSMLQDSCDVKVLNLNSRGENFGISYEVSEGNYEVLLDPVSAGSLSAYVRVPGQTQNFYAARDNGTVVLDSKFSSSLETPGYRYTFVIFGDSGVLEVLKLQDEPK